MSDNRGRVQATVTLTRPLKNLYMSQRPQWQQVVEQGDPGDLWNQPAAPSPAARQYRSVCTLSPSSAAVLASA
jgi:hypothetical protein